MSARTHAIRVGLRRGWTEARLSLRNPEDLIFYLLWGGGAVAWLFANRNTPLEGTDLTLPSLALPGLLAAMLIFGAMVGPAFTLVLEREDGTLLRAKAAPNGMAGYVTGQVVLQSLSALPMLVILLVPSALLFDGLRYVGPGRWAALAGFIVLGMLATMPLGIIIGSLARKPSHVSTWGLLPVIGLAVISGIFAPVTTLWGWVQGLAQVFPMYWLGVGMRWTFLPEEAVMLELGGEWRVLEAVIVLGVWAAVGLALTPIVLRRMARRESGSTVQARMAERMQRLG
jgi:ABC-2 type transport system permease protein